MASDVIPHSIELLETRAVAVCASATGVPGEGTALLLGFDGLPSTVAWQLDEATRLLTGAGARAVTVLDDDLGARVLALVRDLPAGVADPLAVARVTVLPTQVGPYLVEATSTIGTIGLRMVSAAHAGSGILRLVLTAAEGGGEVSRAVKALGLLRDQARASGGELRLEWAPLTVKEELAVWETPGPAGRLMAQIKRQLDPQGVMNPGRFVSGI
jgi:glycolate oxidase FAD binding subunit